MTTQDARSLSPSAQEALRKRAVKAIVDRGMKQTRAAKVFGVSRVAISQWMHKYREKGIRGLKARKQGRPAEPRLSKKQVAVAKRIIRDRCPNQVKLPFVLWTREAVKQLLLDRFDIDVSVTTVGRYLKSWGFTPQKPLRRAYERDPAAVDRWLKEDYPAIRSQARLEKAQIHWGDEMGLRSDHQTGRTYGVKGRTPVVPGTGKRFSCNMISTVTNRGKLAFSVFTERFTSDVFIKFLRQLLRHTERKIFLVVDRHPVHCSGKVRDWFAKHSDEIRLFFLPSYSPDLNPDEMLNQDVKSNAVGRRRPENLGEMQTDIRTYLRSTQAQPNIVQSYFKAQPVRYAAN